MNLLSKGKFIVAVSLVTVLVIGGAFTGRFSTNFEALAATPTTYVFGERVHELILDSEDFNSIDSKRCCQVFLSKKISRGDLYSAPT